MVWNHVAMLSLALAIIIQIKGANLQKPKLGGTINMFNDYGHLAEKLRAVPSSDGDNAAFHWNSGVDVFKIPPQFSNIFLPQKTILLVGHIHLGYYFNAEDLVDAYFQSYDIEGVEKSSRAINNDWSNAAIGKHFGLEESIIGGDYCYVLLKIVISRDNQVIFGLPDNLDLKEAAATESRNVVINDTANADRFISKFGTHYISSYATGDAIYQVLVFEPWYCRRLQNKEESTALTEMSEYLLSNISSSLHAFPLGTIKSASGSRSVEAWAAENLSGRNTHLLDVRPYSSLIQIRSNYTLFRKLDKVIQDKVVLRMQLKTLAPVFVSPIRRKWFQQYIHQRLAFLSTGKNFSLNL